MRAPRSIQREGAHVSVRQRSCPRYYDRPRAGSACDVRTRSSIVTASGAKGTSLFAAVAVAASWIIAWMSDLRSGARGCEVYRHERSTEGAQHRRQLSELLRARPALGCTHGRSLSGDRRCGAVRVRVDFRMPLDTVGAFFAFGISNSGAAQLSRGTGRSPS